MDADGLLRVVTFSSGVQPFVVRCEHETRVRDIVLAIAEIWGFREAAPLFTLCRPAADCPDTSDVLQLLRGATLLSWHDRPCQTQGGVITPDNAPLLLIRCIFGSANPALEQNQAVQSLTAVQISADVLIGRYPPQADGNLLQHLVKQGQHAVVLQMASCWPTGACLTMGPAHVLSGSQELQLPASVNIGLHSRALHIMDSQQCRVSLPIDSIKAVAAAGDVLNITFQEGMPDLLLQLSGAEAIAEAFNVHKQAALQRLQQQQIALGIQPAAAAAAAIAADDQPLSVQIALVPEPPCLRATIEVVEEPIPEKKLLAVQLKVQEPAAAAEGEQVVQLQLTPLAVEPVEPAVHVKLHITPEAEPAAQSAEEQQLVRLVIRMRGNAAGKVAANHVNTTVNHANAARGHTQQLPHLLHKSSGHHVASAFGGQLGAMSPSAAAAAAATTDPLLHMRQGDRALHMLPGMSNGPVNAMIASSPVMQRQPHEVRQGVLGLQEKAALTRADSSGLMQQSSAGGLPGMIPRGNNNTRSQGMQAGVQAAMLHHRPMFPQTSVRPQGPGVRPRPQLHHNMMVGAGGNDMLLMQPGSAAMQMTSQGQLVQAGSMPPGVSIAGQQFQVAGQPTMMQQARPPGMQYASAAGNVLLPQHQQLRQQLGPQQQQGMQVAQPQMGTPAGFMVVQQQQQQQQPAQQLQQQMRQVGGATGQQVVIMPVGQQMQHQMPGAVLQQGPVAQQGPMVLLTTADGRQLLVPERQLQQQQQIQLQQHFQQGVVVQQQSQASIIQQQQFATLQQFGSQQPQQLVQQPMQQQLQSQYQQQQRPSQMQSLQMQQAHQQAHLNPGVFVVGPGGELVPVGGQPAHSVGSGSATPQQPQHGVMQPGAQPQQQQQLFAQQQSSVAQLQQRQQLMQQQQLLQQQQQQQQQQAQQQQLKQQLQQRQFQQQQQQLQFQPQQQLQLQQQPLQQLNFQPQQQQQLQFQTQQQQQLQLQQQQQQQLQFQPQHQQQLQFQPQQQQQMQFQQQQLQMPTGLEQLNNQQNGMGQFSHVAAVSQSEADMPVMQGIGMVDLSNAQQQFGNVSQAMANGPQLQLQQQQAGLSFQQQQQHLPRLGVSVTMSTAMGSQLHSQGVMMGQQPQQLQQPSLQMPGQQQQQLLMPSQQQQQIQQLVMQGGNLGDNSSNSLLHQHRRSSGTNAPGGNGLFPPPTGLHLGSSGPPSNSSLGGLQATVGSNRMDPSLPGLGSCGSLGMGVGVIGDGAGGVKSGSSGVGLAGMGGVGGPGGTFGSVGAPTGAFGAIRGPASHTSLDGMSLGAATVDPPGLNFGAGVGGSSFGTATPKAAGVGMDATGQSGLGVNSGLLGGGLGIADGAAAGGFVFQNGSTILGSAVLGGQGVFGADPNQSLFF